jgi:hypothetical protein
MLLDHLFAEGKARTASQHRFVLPRISRRPAFEPNCRKNDKPRRGWPVHQVETSAKVSIAILPYQNVA